MIKKILSNIDYDLFFDKWYEEYESSDNFEDYVWYNQSEETEEFHSESPNATEEEFNKWENNQLRKYAREWFDNHIDEWDEQIEKKCQVEGDHVLVYRALTVKDENEFIDLLKNGKYIKGYSGLGVFWSWDEDKADSHWGSYSEGEKEVLLKAKIHYSLIDIDTSLILNFSPSLGLDEAEFQLIEGNDIHLLSIVNSNNKEIEINKNLII